MGPLPVAESTEVDLLAVIRSVAVREENLKVAGPWRANLHVRSQAPWSGGSLPLHEVHWLRPHIQPGGGAGVGSTLCGPGGC